MPDNHTEKLSLRDMLAKASIPQVKISEKAKVTRSTVCLVVAGRTKSKRIEDIILAEVEKALTQGQKA